MNVIKSAFVILIFVAALLSIGKIFWEEELKYTRPTPVPEEYVPVPVSQVIDVDMLSFQKSNKPKHLHFYNPECPCSRFNLSHFTSLVAKYKDAIDFQLVIPSEEHLEEVAAEFNYTIPVIADEGDILANACGVYSTPQAVLIDTNGQLYYRGNYNKSRYCTEVSTNYAQLAIDSLLADKPAPSLGALATTAFGCELNKKSWLVSFTL